MENKTKNVLKTSAQWMKEKKYRRHTIVEPTGWSKERYNYEWFHEPIDEIEFQTRLCYSAVINGAYMAPQSNGGSVLRYDVESSWSHPWTAQLPSSAEDPYQN